MSDRFPSYEEMEKPHRQSFVRPLINGSRCGSAKCLGYCHFDEHPGFLNQKLLRKHQCLEKDCKYFQPKPRRPKRPQEEVYNRAADIVEFSNKIMQDCEGIKAVKAEQDSRGDWIVRFVAVASCEKEHLEVRISRLAGEKVRLKQLSCSFDHAAKIIFG